jgi:stage II sporulation protein AA (anti-sigma F factor antagonist)
MSVQTTYDKGELRITLNGEIDHHSARTAMTEISEAIDLKLPRNCVLDLTGVNFTDSSGIAVLLRTQKKINELDGEFWVENVRPQPAKVFKAANVGIMVAIKE